MARRRGQGQEVLLVHPETLDAHRCRIIVSRRGIRLRRQAPTPSRTAPEGEELLVPWRTVQGFGADGTAEGPHGTLLQMVEVVTDDGTLLLMAPAPDVSVFLATVGRWRGRWRLSHVRPLAAVHVRLAGVSAALDGLVGRRADQGRFRSLLRPGLAVAVALLMAVGAFLGVTGGETTRSGAEPTSLPPVPHAGSAGDAGAATIARLMQERPDHKKLDLPAATAPPAPAPPTLANEPPLRPHEVFGFAPYWTLTQATGFNLGGLTTIAYFSIGVNADGTLDESGAGWEGYQSQALANLVTRAHAAGVRVVLTVNCFDQGALDAVTSSPSAPATLSAAVVAAVEAKNLDGVNIDFEGEGSSDQVGLTNLVTKVSAAVHAANPHYQVTMDTYASSAGDPGGFYDIPALAPAVDGFFVMAYQLNLQSGPNPASPLTSTQFSDLTTAQQYSSAVAPGKVIMGLPFYGEKWPTTNGTMAAEPTGTATPISYAQIMSGGHPVYWDTVTDTAWSSFQVGSQWYEEYFEDPTSLYLAAQMSQFYGLAGVGAWALGMDGNDPTMVGALDGLAPAQKVTGPGPTSGAPPPGAPTASGGPTGSSGTPTSDGASPLHYSGVWGGQTVDLTLQPWHTFSALGTPRYLGRLTGFVTNDPNYACLSQATGGLAVWSFGPSPTLDTVVAEQPTNCAAGDFTFSPPAGSSGGTGSGSGSTPPSNSTTTTSTTTTAPSNTTTTTAPSNGTTTTTTAPGNNATTEPSGGSGTSGTGS